MVNSSNDLTVLVGNGLSIACNPELALASITQEVISRIEREHGGATVEAMKKVAVQLIPDKGNVHDKDFEKLVGAFGLEHRTLDLLENLSNALGDRQSGMKVHIEAVSDFVADVRNQGLSHVLQVITERSHYSRINSKGLAELINGICGRFNGRITFGNLNYDTILMAGILNSDHSDRLTDLADPRRGAKCLSEDLNLHGFPLRDELNFPPSKSIRLLHLHGSICFWQRCDDGKMFKIAKGEMESSDIARHLRGKGSVDWEPTIVLTSESEKARVVEEHPFSLAYKGIENELNRTRHWLIIGYSFRDQPINEMLRRAFLDFDPKPSVLVVSFGNDVTRNRVEEVLGWGEEDRSPDSWLRIDSEGALGMYSRDPWKEFVNSGY